MAAKPKAQKFIIGGLMYILLFAGAKEDIGGRANDDKCGGEERLEEKVLGDAGMENGTDRIKETTIEHLLTIKTTTSDLIDFGCQIKLLAVL